MDVKNTQQKFNVNPSTTITAANTTVQKKSDSKFADELKKVEKNQEKDSVKETESLQPENAVNKSKEAKETEASKEEKEVQEANEAKESEKAKETEQPKEPEILEETDETKEIKEIKEPEQPEKTEKPKESKDKKETENIVNIKESAIDSIDNAIDGLQDIVSKFNKIGQKDELENETIKSDIEFADKKNISPEEDDILIDNNMNIQEPKEKINVQTEANMNFNSSEQPFSQFVNQEQSKDVLKSSAKELAEEKAILSTMEENIAIAKKNMLMKERAKEIEKAEAEQQAKPKTETVQNDKGIKKVDTKTHIVVDTIVSYENVVMDKADVDFFVNLVENGVVNLSEVQNAAKSSQVSKTLADLLAKAMNENKPVRIDFDNDISVIIKIDRAGKISADFLPSSQIAEAYLKENLPLLKQRFDDNNIEYNELNQRKQKQDSQENRKKGQKNE